MRYFKPIHIIFEIEEVHWRMRLVLEIIVRPRQANNACMAAPKKSDASRIAKSYGTTDGKHEMAITYHSEE